MPTIKDVAQKAGVSIATVSRFLNGSGYVSEEVKLKLIQVINELGYKRKYTAHILASRKKRKVAMVISERIKQLLNTDIGYFYKVIVESIQQNAETFHFEISLLDLRRVEKFDGYLLIGSDALEQDVQEYKRLGKVVLVDHHVEGLMVDSVVSAGADAATFLVNRFLEMGKKRIIHVHGPLKYYGFRDRYQGYVNTMQKYGLLPITFEYDDLHDDIEPVVKKILANYEPDVIFCSNDVIALRVMEKLKAFGYEIPKKISVVGFDDIPEAERLGLTTFHVDKYEMGVTAVRRLYDLLVGHNVQPRKICLHAYFVKRNSSL
ncbi:LacI family DNA-binding transcriptional regulator [Pseudothermotoga thermarum]|uniref:Transcriptional regulator, LacI family n=1 Tax=Pseudothermotoga thermarum DSM 5069 TaxID=688269 RepID=F7YXC5_9THEM|nr:LacI family DNA-binding transcriptional regulator [Pseudothermotoga thermarum]AEH51608.1 transcriptional regulator, LacI family [Pseudothermotoga thermarum DSM 5069]